MHRFRRYGFLSKPVAPVFCERIDYKRSSQNREKQLPCSTPMSDMLQLVVLPIQELNTDFVRPDELKHIGHLALGGERRLGYNFAAKTKDLRSAVASHVADLVGFKAS